MYFQLVQLQQIRSFNQLNIIINLSTHIFVSTFSNPFRLFFSKKTLSFLKEKSKIENLITVHNLRWEKFFFPRWNNLIKQNFQVLNQSIPKFIIICPDPNVVYHLLSLLLLLHNCNIVTSLIFVRKCVMNSHLVHFLA